MTSKILTAWRPTSLLAGATALFLWSCNGGVPFGPSEGRSGSATLRSESARSTASGSRPSGGQVFSEKGDSDGGDGQAGALPIQPGKWTPPGTGGHVATVGEAPPTPGPEPTVARPDHPVYATANNPPLMRLRTSPPFAPGDPYPVISGPAPLTVRFNLCKSSDPDEGDPDDDSDGDSLNWQFHFGDDGTQPFRSDGTFNANFARFCRTEHTYASSGSYVATVSVTDKHLEDQSRNVSGLARVTQRLTILVGPSVSAAPAPDMFVCYATNFRDFAQTAAINTSPNGDFYGSSDGSCTGGIAVEGTLVQAVDLSSASAICSSILGPRGIVSSGAVAAGGDLAADYWFCSYIAPM